jgi:ABC-type thiamin/hydroxymethylpyrimidine transport system permease subunit
MLVFCFCIPFFSNRTLAKTEMEFCDWKPLFLCYVYRNHFCNVFIIQMNLSDLIQRLIKYLVVGLAVAVCAVLIPKKSPAVEEVTALALAAACTMAIVDTFTNPVIAHSLNQGLGFGLGANLVGFPRL